MIEVYVLTAVALVIAGAVLGFIAIVALGIHREEAARSMTVPTSDRIAGGTRTANGFYARTPGVIQEALTERQVGPRLGAGPEAGEIAGAVKIHGRY